MLPFQDLRIIQRQDNLEVVAWRHEVMWRDGSAVQLHPVRVSGVDQTFMRAMQLEGLRWFVFDLLQLPGVPAKELQGDILRLLPRDTPGVVHFTMRMAYPNAKAFCDAVQACCTRNWWHLNTAPLSEAA